MNEGPVVLGINRTQDASICLMDGSSLQWAIQKERLTRHKHHWGRGGDVSRIYWPRLPGLDRPIDVLVECYSSDAEIGNFDAYQRELEETLVFAPAARRVRISHHLAHLYSAFHPSPFRQAAVMIVDGQGSEVGDIAENWRGRNRMPGHYREVSSFYSADRSRIDCLGKQLWDRDEQRLAGLGMFYFLLTQAIFPGEGNEGKVMGLAPHGDAAALRMPPLEVEGGSVHIPPAWRSLLRDRERFRYAGPDDARFTDIANLAAAGQRAFEEALLGVARWLHGLTGALNLCFAGGTGLNCSVNERLVRETPFSRVFIPPAPGDAGTAIGCALYGFYGVRDEPCGFRWTSDYLGPVPDPAETAVSLMDAAAASDLKVERIDHQAALCERLAGLLASGQVAGLFRGRSEFGPRALGHRSILADARHPGMRDWINARVKQREWFRPLAPVVLLERAHEFFDLTHPAPFMQYAVPVNALGATLLPAVTHVDRSARVQTVGPGDDPFLRALLQAFEAHSGVPVLLNTSFNRKEEPIVETVAEAIAAFRATPMHVLAVPPFVITKRVAPEPVSA